MNKTESARYVEEVQGQIIGGDPLKRGQLFYDGRPQGPTFQGETDAELRSKAKAEKDRHKAQCGRDDVFRAIYPLDAWELRIWD